MKGNDIFSFFLFIVLKKQNFSSGLLFSLARGTLEEKDSTGVRG